MKDKKLVVVIRARNIGQPTKDSDRIDKLKKNGIEVIYAEELLDRKELKGSRKLLKEVITAFKGDCKATSLLSFENKVKINHNDMLSIDKKIDVNFISSCGANYFSSESRIKCDPVPFAGIQVGDKVTKLGSKKRSSFELKNSFWMEYFGMYTLRGIRHLVFRTEDMEEPIDGMHWCYCFAVVDSSKNILFLSSTNMQAGRDIVIDKFEKL